MTVISIFGPLAESAAVPEPKSGQVIVLESAPGEIARGLRPLVPRSRSGPTRASRASSNPARGLAGLSNSRPSGAKPAPQRDVARQMKRRRTFDRNR